jgi:ABC-2 type transport system ATP-binding protein
MSIVVENLTKLYGSQLALDNVTFSVAKGEVLGLLGPNGAGKSTTMKILTGYLLANDGKAEICGLDVVKHPIETKRKTGYLPEHNPLYLDMFVREYLEFTGGIYGISSSKIKNRIEELIELTGLTAERKKKISQLSKGYRQRVGLAQALIHDPEVLILDEPTTGLDPNQIVEIRNLIKEIGKSKTVILSTHIMQEVSAICNRAVIISKGKIVADRKIEELTSNLGYNKKLLLKFKQRYDYKWIKLLEGVLNIKINGENGLAIETQPGLEDTLQAEIFTEAAKRNQILTGIEWEETNLESVFQELTR